MRGGRRAGSRQEHGQDSGPGGEQTPVNHQHRLRSVSIRLHSDTEAAAEPGDAAGRADRYSLPGAVTKSISSSTRPRNSGSRSAKDVTERRMRCQAAAVLCGHPIRASTPSFQGSPGGTRGQPGIPITDGLTAAQTSMNGCPTISTCGELTWAAILVSFEPSTR